MGAELLRDVERRRRLVESYYRNFEGYREEGGYAKAGESLWGVVNNLLYLLGLTQGLKLSSRGKLKEFVRDLAAAKRDEGIIEGFHAAETLHANFYHEFMDRDLFQASSEKALELVRKLERILAEELEKLKAPRFDARDTRHQGNRRPLLELLAAGMRPEEVAEGYKISVEDCGQRFCSGKDPGARGGNRCRESLGSSWTRTRA